MKLNSFAAKLETAILNGKLDSELLDGVKIEFEANVLKMSSDGSSVSIDPLTVGAKLTGNVASWFDIGRDIQIKLEGGLQVALGGTLLADQLSKVAQAEIEQRMLVTEMETVAQTVGTHATAVRELEAQLATAQSRGLARHEIQALERQVFEHKGQIRAGARQLERLSGHIAEAQVRAARVLGGVKNIVAKKIGKAMEVRAIKFVAGKLVKIIPILNVASTILDIVDLIVLIHALIKGKYGSGGDEGDQEGKHAGNSPASGHNAEPSSADPRQSSPAGDEALVVIRSAPPEVIGHWFEVRGEELEINDVGLAWQAAHTGMHIGGGKLAEMQIVVTKRDVGEWDLRLLFAMDNTGARHKIKHDFWVTRGGTSTVGAKIGDLAFEPLMMLNP